MMKNKRVYWAISCYFFLFFFGFAACYSLYSVWLSQTVGLSNFETGVVFGVNAAVTLLAQPIYGYILDRIGLKKHILIILALLLIFAGPFFSMIYGQMLRFNLLLGSVVGGLFVGVGFQAGSSALESYSQKLSLKYSFEYGPTRMWGSLGWAASAFFAGKLFSLNPDLNFWLTSVAALLMLLVILSVKIEPDFSPERKVKSVSLRDFGSLLQQSDFWKLVFYSVGVSCAYNLYDQQYPTYFASLFASASRGEQIFGYVNAGQVILEAGMMFLAPKLVKYLGSKNSLILAGLVMAIRIMLSGIAGGPVWLALMKLAESFEIPLILVAIFKYLDQNFELRLSSILYLFGFQFSRQLSQIVLSIVMGKSYDYFGFGKSYLLLGLAVLIFDLLSLRLLKNDQSFSVN